MIKIISIFEIFLLLHSCCTSKDCYVEYNPEIIIRFDGFDSSDLSKVSVVLVDTNSLKTMDSIVFTNESNILKIYYRILSDKEIEIKDYNYIIKTNVTIDTIYQVKYEKYSETIECNTCFPFGDGSDAPVIDYRDFSYCYRQNKYNDKDTLVLKK